MEGYLSKWTNMVNGWQYRWFILDDNSGILSYYTSKEKMLRGVRRGCVRLKSAVVGIDDQDDCSFTISVDHKTFHFQTRSARDREDWVRALEDTIRSHSLKKPWTSLRPPTSVIDFEKKLSESDSYLQILIEETKKLKERIDNMKEDEQKAKYKTVLDHANVMLDNIKHSIVLLQIAKNTGHPVNGIFRTNTISEISEMIMEKDKSIDELSQISDLNMNINTESLNDNTNPLSVPEMSYSSSENEEDFFDANDFAVSIEQKISKKSVDTNPETAQFDDYVNQDDESTADSYKTTAKASYEDNASIDYDELYENNEEDNVDTMENHGSVISHLLSQVKIGMDLTKVALPTFILERRSLLEMYADYFAHPDLFVRTVDIKDPKERFIHVVKWYLSSFHAGRKSTVAKKPYNPILGEVFRCYWNIDDHSNNNDNCNAITYENGPLPWCSKDQLVFIAEQVSHHPPVSAFYAEHYNKRITFCAHIYTKSRFLGLSVCVMNIGQGIVTLHDYDEEYIVTFPNGYGRSILTVPWIELGGSTTIECQKTGYKCDIEFITKPFYSNKKNRISATLYDTRNGKKVFMNINGEWNGVMEAKGPDNETKFTIDVSKLSIEKKIVKPIAKQEDNESRRVWKEVTAGLKFNDIDRATRSKMIIEQKQRDEAKGRKSLNQQWENKHFIEDGDNWKYVNPLKNRLQ